MRLVFLASGAFAEPTLRWLHQSEHEVALVITQPARAGGRGRGLTPTPIRALADELKLPTLEADNVNTPEMVGRIQALGAPLGLVIAFGQKLGADVLATFTGGCINLHASLLPKYRGAAPIQWAILRGEGRTGCTVFRIVDRMDAGPILAADATLIHPDETAGELHNRLAIIGAETVQTALRLLIAENAAKGTPQNEAEVSLAPKLDKSDGQIQFDRPVVQVINHIRGMTPWPGASARFEGTDGRWENVTVTRVRRVGEAARPAIPPGTLDARRFVAVGDGFLEILEIKPSSGRSMTWQDYLNGRRVSPGDRFTQP